MDSRAECVEMPPWRSAGLFFALVLLVGSCEGGTVLRNVTVSGLNLSWSATVLPVGWNASRLVQVGTVKNTTGVCPAGRYCPRGTSVPFLCALGTYDTTLGRTTQCSVSCSLDYYCPDPGQRLPCPTNTNSGRGATSQLQCVCKAGYQCVYKRYVLANVRLNIPYRVWISAEGAKLKEALLQAVADTARVPLGSVRVSSVLPGLVTGGAGGSRRLLGEKQADTSAVLSISVEGAEGLDGLREALHRRRKEFKGGARVHWKRADQLKVLPAPPGRAWDWRVWRARRA